MRRVGEKNDTKRRLKILGKVVVRGIEGSDAKTILGFKV